MEVIVIFSKLRDQSEFWAKSSVDRHDLQAKTSTDKLDRRDYLAKNSTNRGIQRKIKNNFTQG